MCRHHLVTTARSQVVTLVTSWPHTHLSLSEVLYTVLHTKSPRLLGVSQFRSWFSRLVFEAGIIFEAGHHCHYYAPFRAFSSFKKLSQLQKFSQL